MTNWRRAFPFALAAAFAAAPAASAPAGQDAAAAALLTVGEARTLATAELAKRLLGGALASQVIEAVRQEDRFSTGTVPGSVEFYLQPVRPDPRVNRICRADVITVEYDLTRVQVGQVRASTPLRIAHIEAVPRYKSFPMPPGSPVTRENEAAQAAACAGMKRATDAFRAPSAGDAQWLDAVEREYRGAGQSFAFTCDDPEVPACARARRVLPELRLERAVEVRRVDCPPKRTGNMMDLCYRLSFLRGQKACPDRRDRERFECENVEWVLTVVAGIATASSPVRIVSLHLERQVELLSLS
jgi:hypothetical protein